MKRVIVCCDGTWDDTDNQSADTNVFRMARAIHATQETGGVLQIVLYLSGVGTSGLQFEKLVAGAIGVGVGDNIRSAYMFIAQNYQPGDEIFLFGFSRGAFTARSLAGLVNACGILKRQNLGDLPNAWAYYRTTGSHSPQEFKQRYDTDCHTDAKIKFLGVWDTVGALGVPGHLFSAENAAKFAFHNTGPCAVIEHGCQALAIDEHRHDFVPTLWTEPAPEGVRIEQVWFAGAHSDVGGGYVTRTLADIPLVWMARKAEQDGSRSIGPAFPIPRSLRIWRPRMTRAAACSRSIVSARRCARSCRSRSKCRRSNASMRLSTTTEIVCRQSMKWFIAASSAATARRPPYAWPTKSERAVPPSISRSTCRRSSLPTGRLRKE